MRSKGILRFHGWVAEPVIYGTVWAAVLQHVGGIHSEHPSPMMWKISGMLDAMARETTSSVATELISFSSSNHHLTVAPPYDCAERQSHHSQ
ncbi:hypothetical protein [Saccharopolyspora sp. 5N708]|uniref:hypothetical protein n=1 Tax=Saccharopolyspora sp. 5N708 TaxID=3457424 RepID=UPI003FCF7BBC